MQAPSKRMYFGKCNSTRALLSPAWTSSDRRVTRLKGYKGKSSAFCQCLYHHKDQTLKQRGNVKMLRLQSHYRNKEDAKSSTLRARY